MRGTAAIVVLLGLAGLIAGVAYAATVSPSSYTATTEFTLPAHSRDAIRLAAVARSQHVPGVRVLVLNAHAFNVTGHGSLAGSVGAEMAVDRHVWKVIKDMSLTHVSWMHSGVHAYGLVPRGKQLQAGGIGLLAGLGAGLGIVVPRRRRKTSVPA